MAESSAAKKRSPLRGPQVAFTLLAPVSFFLASPELGIMLAILAVAVALLVLGDER
ncbi:hypothetical protein GCM10009616_35960 [Microlunatus lacustris]